MEMLFEKSGCYLKKKRCRLVINYADGVLLTQLLMSGS